jgi:transforming growth factor-beta-induced protein
MKTTNLFKSTGLLLAVAMIIISGSIKSYAEDLSLKTSDMTIVEIASADDRFSTLVEAVVKADLVEALSASGPFTVFAPTNDAFNKLFKTLGVNGITDLSKEQLTPILLYHVVGSKVMAKEVQSGMVQTLNKTASIDVNVSKKGVKIDKSNVIITDIEASNGVIHVIDTVLLPSSDDQAKVSKSSCN